MLSKTIQQWIQQELTQFMKIHPGGRKVLEQYYYQNMTEKIFKIFPHNKQRTLDTLYQYTAGFVKQQQNLTKSLNQSNSKQGKNNRANRHMLSIDKNIKQIYSKDNGQFIQQNEIMNNKTYKKSRFHSISQQKSKKSIKFKSRENNTKDKNYKKYQQKQQQQKQTQPEQDKDYTIKMSSSRLFFNTNAIQQINQKKPHFKIQCIDIKIRRNW